MPAREWFPAPAGNQVPPHRRLAHAARPVAPAAVALAAVALAAVAPLAGCSRPGPIVTPRTNERPEVRLTFGPIDTTARNSYSVALNWTGYDPDGRVDYYAYAIDPTERAGGETTWVNTRDHEKRLTFSANDPSPGADSLRTARAFHVFVLTAVDNEGARALPVSRAFFTYTVAPTVSIQAPRPSALLELLLPPSVRITWAGLDADGVSTTRPTRYKYLLLGPSADFPGGIAAAMADPGSLRRHYAPDFAETRGWVPTGAEGTFAQFTDLVPGASYLFVVVAFDEAGAYSPIFSLNSNVLRFKVGYAATLGPRITLFNEFFHYRYPGGGYTVDPSAWIHLEVPVSQKVAFGWYAEPPPGADIRSYRWMLDGDVFDEQPRSDESTDTRHWSTRSGNITTAAVGPFEGAGSHMFYVEAEDNTGLRSLGIVNFMTVGASLESPLLVVNDTRFSVDEISRVTQKYRPPTGPWPTAAELDTFLFARGDYPMKGDYPEGALSPAGLFRGYPYDTMGTRSGTKNLTVPLSALGRYAHVLWLVDGRGATFFKDGQAGNEAMTSLRYMCSPGQANTLAIYARQGGLVWLAGGGGAFASLIPYNDPADDQPTFTFSSLRSTRNPRELGPGRFMHDLARWQSEIRMASARGLPVRHLGRFERSPGLYALLPRALERKTPATDPLPALRGPGDFFSDTFPFEFLQVENHIREATQARPTDLDVESFDDAEPSALLLRWKSTDSLNTVASQDPVGAKGRALRVATQGGGASLGDNVSRTFASPRDWSGLAALMLSIKQDQPASRLQWRVRIVDSRGGSRSALIPVDGHGTYEARSIAAPSFVDDSQTLLDLGRVSRLEFECATDAAAGNTWFDAVAIASTADVPVLDTLYHVRASSLPDSLTNPYNVVMTYYHGRDSAPFLFTGFSLWGFRRAQCQQLVDFVLQHLWGMSRVANGPGLSPRVASASRARRIERDAGTAGPDPAAVEGGRALEIARARGGRRAPSR